MRKKCSNVPNLKQKFTELGIGFPIFQISECCSIGDISKIAIYLQFVYFGLQIADRVFLFMGLVYLFSGSEVAVWKLKEG